LNLIVAVDENWGIGNKGELLERISEDMKFFKEKTTNNIIVMGRVTFESLPNQKALPNRVNIVLSESEQNFKDTIIVNSIDNLFSELEKHTDKEVYIIGGAKIYNLLYKKCRKAYITKIYNTYESDAKMFNLDKDSNWEIINKSEIKTNKNGVKFQFVEYNNKGIK